jgi:hypothetical protein
VGGNDCVGGGWFRRCGLDPLAYVGATVMTRIEKYKLIEKCRAEVRKHSPPTMEVIEVRASAAQIQRGGNMLDASLWDYCESSLIDRSAGNQVWTKIWIEAPDAVDGYFSIELGRHHKLIAEGLRQTRSEKPRTLGCGALVRSNTAIVIYVQDCEIKKPTFVRVSILGWELTDAVVDLADKIFPKVTRIP